MVHSLNPRIEPLTDHMSNESTEISIGKQYKKGGSMVVRINNQNPVTPATPPALRPYLMVPKISVEN